MDDLQQIASLASLSSVLSPSLIQLTPHGQLLHPSGIRLDDKGLRAVYRAKLSQGDKGSYTNKL